MNKMRTIGISMLLSSLFVAACKSSTKTGHASTTKDADDFAIRNPAYSVSDDNLKKGEFTGLSLEVLGEKSSANMRLSMEFNKDLVDALQILNKNSSFPFDARALTLFPRSGDGNAENLHIFLPSQYQAVPGHPTPIDITYKGVARAISSDNGWNCMDTGQLTFLGFPRDDLNPGQTGSALSEVFKKLGDASNQVFYSYTSKTASVHFQAYEETFADGRKSPPHYFRVIFCGYHMKNDR